MPSANCAKKMKTSGAYENVSVVWQLSSTPTVALKHKSLRWFSTVAVVAFWNDRNVQWSFAAEFISFDLRHGARLNIPASIAMIHRWRRKWNAARPTEYSTRCPTERFLQSISADFVGRPHTTERARATPVILNTHWRRYLTKGNEKSWGVKSLQLSENLIVRFRLRQQQALVDYYLCHSPIVWVRILYCFSSVVSVTAK